MLEGLKWLFSLVVGRRKEKVPLIDLRAPPQVKRPMQGLWRRSCDLEVKSKKLVLFNNGGPVKFMLGFYLVLTYSESV